MAVSNQQRHVQGFSLCAAQKILSQADDATARVQDQRMLAGLHLDTGCVASMTHRGWPRRGVTSASPPETNQKTLSFSHLTCSCRSLNVISACTYYILQH